MMINNEGGLVNGQPLDVNEVIIITFCSHSGVCMFTEDAVCSVVAGRSCSS